MPARGRQQKRKTWVAGDAPSKKRDVKDTPSPRISPPPPPQRIAVSPAAYTERAPTPPPPPPPPPQPTPHLGSDEIEIEFARRVTDGFRKFELWFIKEWEEKYSDAPKEYTDAYVAFRKAAGRMRMTLCDACLGTDERKRYEEEEEEKKKSSRVEAGTQTEAVAPVEKENGEAPPKRKQKKKEKSHPTPPEKAKTKAKAVVVHGVSVSKSLVAVRQEMERRKKRDRVCGVRWLLGKERREGKKESSVVVYFEREVEVDEFYRIGMRRHRASVYEWDRGSKG